MIAILDYEAGNLTSVALAVRHLGAECQITSDAAVAGQAERLIFPGVGAARSAMDALRRHGLDRALREALAVGKPVLAICIGMQLAFEWSEEDGGTVCLGLLPGKVKRFSFSAAQHIKVPHMGWNEVVIKRPHPLLADLTPGAECYFVHSYYAAPTDVRLVYAETEYAGRHFCSAAGKDNFFAVQFHPEKSGEVGLAIIRRFLSWDGRIAS